MTEGIFSTENAAWWGAVVATFVLGWEIYKWIRSGPRVKVDVGANMKFYGPIPDDKTYITIRAINTGDGPTTLTNLGFVHYKNLIQYFFNKPKQSYVVPMPVTQQRIPHELRPGTIWDSSVVQNDEIEELGKKGIVAIHLYHSHSNRPIKKKIKFKKMEGR